MFLKDITNLQTNIIDKRGQKIIVKGSLGRGKEFKKEGTIEEAYSNHFTLRYDEEERPVSYSYKDLLIGAVEVDVFNGEEFSPLVQPLTVESRRKTKV